ncbi:SDR family NAD(P)-dependent oxidoreductase [Mucilaginibacter sp.]|uniref:SDR family NAD(P)-dependent oxidoreductase n=1 Tax=Mucilaginibacter sp. TaxID=1882438 RepID=UPI003D1083C7
MSLEKKIVLIAGRKSIAMISIVKMLLNEKATIIVVAKSASDLDFINEIKAANDEANLVTILVDYPDYYKAVEIVDEITESFGRIDACIFYFESPAIEVHLLDTDITDWEKMVELNISAYYVAVRSVFEAMKVNRQGLFVSIHERLTDCAHHSSKLAQLSKSIHKEMAGMFFDELENFGIRFYHLLVEKEDDAESAGPFVRQLFETGIPAKSDLFLHIPQRK